MEQRKLHNVHSTMQGVNEQFFKHNDTNTSKTWLKAASTNLDPN